MSSIDILRSFAESRAGNDEIVPGITYRVCRDLLADRDRLREALKELTTAVESECKHDTVLRKSLAPYCEAARLALEAKDEA